ncbi:NAD(P)-binding domain-containing protein [Streptomyces sp. NPDC048256]|uniref:NAD(P)-binding domain-containing protein n=1 Tax=unclassified Streptomyces TaxID=2593676 RepID=UPI00340BB367
MTTIGTIGAGEVGSQTARAALVSGYEGVIANSRGPETPDATVRSRPQKGRLHVRQ